MARIPFQTTIVDENGGVVPGAKLRVQLEISGLPLRPIYDDDGEQITNPATADENGFVRVYTDSGFYRFTPLSADGTTTVGTAWSNVPMGDAAAYDAEELQSGVNLNIVGEYDSGTEYSAGDDVTLDSLIFRSLVDENTGNDPETDPPTSSDYWAFIAIEARVKGTSDSSVTIGTGTKNFSTQSGLGWAVGTRLRATAVSDPSAWMEGQITDYAVDALVINSEITNGSGTFDNWNITITGERGADGTDPGLFMTYDNTTTEGAPASGNFRLDDLDFTSATEMYVSIEDRAGNDLTDRLLDVDNWGEAGARSLLDLIGPDTNEEATFNITDVTDNSSSGYVTFAVVWKGGVDSLTDEDPVSVQFHPFGPQGATGADGGGMRGLSLFAATLTDVDISTELEAGDDAGGVTLIEGKTFGAFGQDDNSENGVYVIQASGAATRHPDFDTWAKIAGGIFPVQSGHFAGQIFQNVDDSASGTIDTNDLHFVPTTRSVNARWFGLDEANTATENLAALDAATAVAAGSGGVNCLDVPAGTWPISDTWEIPSNVHIRGAGKFLTTITMPDTVGRGVPVMWTGSTGDPRENITMEDFQVDCNSNRWTVDEVSATHGDEPRGICLKNISNSSFRRVHVKDSYVTNWNIKGGGDQDSGDHNWSTPSTHDLVFEDISSEGPRGDCVAISQSTDVWFVRPKLTNATGQNGQGCGIEIEDGARNIFVIEPDIWGCEFALLLKGHGTGVGAAPSPMNININGGRAINCGSGFECRNADFHSSSTEDTFDDDPTSTEFSPTAFGVNIIGYQVIAPKIPTGSDETTPRCMSLYAYTGIRLMGCYFSDGSQDPDNDLWEEADTVDRVISLASNVRRIQIIGLTVDGFPDATDAGIGGSTSVGGADHRVGLFIDGLHWRNAPDPVLSLPGSSADIYIDNYFVNGSHGTGSICFYLGDNESHAGADIHKHVGHGRIDGYETAVVWAGRNWDNWMFASQPQFYLEDDDDIPSYGATRDSAHPSVKGRELLSYTASKTGTSYMTTSTNSRDAISFEDPDGQCGTLETSGGDLSLNNISDIAMKIDEGLISPEEGLQRMLSLEVHLAKYKRSKKDPRPMFIAQQAGTIVPYAVKGDSSGYESIGTITLPSGCRRIGEQTFVDAEGRRHTIPGTIREESGEYFVDNVPGHFVDECPSGSAWKKTGKRRITLMMDYSKIIPDIVSAIQGLHKLITKEQE